MGEIVKMPQLGETVTEGTILRWLVSVGDEVKEDDPILEISTDKVDTEVPSPFSGKVTALLVDEGETVEVGVSLMELGGEASSDTKKSEPVVEDKSEPLVEQVEEIKAEPHVDRDKNQQLSPIVRKLAKENNIDLSGITGTGKNNRITRKDIEMLISSDGITKPQVQEVKKENSVEVKPVESKKSTGNEIPRLRKRIA